MTLPPWHMALQPCILQPATQGHTAAVQLLLSAGAAVDGAGPERWTALMLAAQHGHNTAMQALLDAGAAVNAANADGATALQLAAEEGHAATVQLLLNTPQV